MNIRLAKEKDLNSLLSLYQELYQNLTNYGLPFQLDLEELNKILAVQFKSKLCLLAVAEDQQHLVGFISAAIIKMERKFSYNGQSTMGIINDVYVKQNYRGSGWAAQLLAHGEQWFADNQISLVECHVLNSNDIALNFWFKHSYQNLGAIVYKQL